MLGELLGEVVGWVIGEIVGGAIFEGLAWLVRKTGAAVLVVFSGWAGLALWWVLSLLGGLYVVDWWRQDPTSGARIAATLVGCLALITAGLVMTAAHAAAARERKQWTLGSEAVPFGTRSFERRALPSRGA